MPFIYHVKKKDNRGWHIVTIDKLSEKKVKEKYPPERLIREDLRIVRVQTAKKKKPKPKKKKTEKKVPRTVEYYKKLSEKTKKKQKKVFEKKGATGKKRSYSEAMKERRKKR